MLLESLVFIINKYIRLYLKSIAKNHEKKSYQIHLFVVVLLESHAKLSAMTLFAYKYYSRISIFDF